MFFFYFVSFISVCVQWEDWLPCAGVCGSTVSQSRDCLDAGYNGAPDTRMCDTAPCGEIHSM